MSKQTRLQKIFKKIRIIRSPKHRLATFGSSQINYQMVSDVPGYPDRSRLRKGEVRAEKPAILTKETLRDKFRGFGSHATRYTEDLVNHYGDALRGLTYQFSHAPHSSKIELISPDQLAKSLAREFDKDASIRHTLISGPDKLWELSIMKFIVEETLSSFSSNVKELDERGFFEGEERHVKRAHLEVQQLLKRAQENRSLVPLLGEKLKKYGLFDHYQDEFFQLVR